VGVVRMIKTLVLVLIPDRVETVYKRHTCGCCKNNLAVVLNFIPDRTRKLHNKHTSGCCENDLTLVLDFIPERVGILHVKLVLGFLRDKVEPCIQNTPVGVVK
jgi:hypothetical protein